MNIVKQTVVFQLQGCVQVETHDRHALPTTDEKKQTINKYTRTKEKIKRGQKTDRQMSSERGSGEP